jgi:hypothetical protein
MTGVERKNETRLDQHATVLKFRWAGARRFVMADAREGAAIVTKIISWLVPPALPSPTLARAFSVP